MSDYSSINTCIACGSSDLRFVFDLGWQPLANSYKLRADDPELKFPLAINSCNECRHVQLTHQVNPNLLFRDYSYISGVSRTTLKFFDWFAQMSMEFFLQEKPKSILDIGCNDGSQLNSYADLGLETFGVDPAETLIGISSARHQVVCDFFREGQFARQFDIVTVQNAFAHNNDQLQLLQNIKPLLKPTSVLFAVTSHAHMLQNGEFDTIYHEHLSFYNITSMQRLCERAGLCLTDVKMYPIHGGSYIFVIQLQNSQPHKVQTLVEQERQAGLYNDSMLDNFRSRSIQNVEKVRNFLKQCVQQNIPIVGYGAPAKSSVFLNYSGLRPQFVIEDTPLKQGKFTPGASIPILAPAAMSQLQYHEQVCWLILAWNFYDEIKEKIRALRPNQSDIFVRYLPEFFIELP